MNSTSIVVVVFILAACKQWCSIPVLTYMGFGYSLKKGTADLTLIVRGIIYCVPHCHHFLNEESLDFNKLRTETIFFIQNYRKKFLK